MLNRITVFNKLGLILGAAIIMLVIVGCSESESQKKYVCEGTAWEKSNSELMSGWRELISQIDEVERSNLSEFDKASRLHMIRSASSIGRKMAEMSNKGQRKWWEGKMAEAGVEFRAGNVPESYYNLLLAFVNDPDKYKELEKKGYFESCFTLDLNT